MTNELILDFYIFGYKGTAFSECVQQILRTNQNMQ
jgi:hypothetical protein